jgi:hypothetical protein
VFRVRTILSPTAVVVVAVVDVDDPVWRGPTGHRGKNPIGTWVTPRADGVGLRVHFDDQDGERGPISGIDDREPDRFARR